MAQKKFAGLKALQRLFDGIKGIVSQEAEARETADDTIKPPKINVSDLDTMGTGSNTSLYRFILNSSKPAHTRYTVVEGSYIVGTLDIFSDSNRHQLTQVFETHYDFSGGKLATSHRDASIRRYFRSFNFDAPHLTVDKNTWTSWKECAPENLAQETGFSGDVTKLQDTSGVSVVSTNGDSVTGLPSDSPSKYGLLFCCGFGSTSQLQVFFSFSHPCYIYSRQKLGGTWRDWCKLVPGMSAASAMSLMDDMGIAVPDAAVTDDTPQEGGVV